MSGIFLGAGSRSGWRCRGQVCNGDRPRRRVCCFPRPVLTTDSGRLRAHSILLGRDTGTGIETSISVSFCITTNTGICSNITTNFSTS
uniref:Uncharacterized protein n=1 Tax=Oryza nivara TaxID=4536 RepID=A0A0E0FPX6_ORYNI